jgi:hypothetical protein
MSDPSRGDAGPDDDGGTAPDATAEVDATVGDGGEPTVADGVVDASASEAPAEGDSGSPLRAIGTAFGLGLLSILILVVVAIVAGGGLSLIGTVTDWQPPFVVQVMVPFALSQIVAFVGLGLAYLRWRGLDADDIVAYLGIRWPSPLEAVIAVIGPFAAIAAVFVALTVVTGFVAEPAPNQGAQVALENPSIIPVMIVGMLLIVGPCEEFLFRGVIQSRARETFSAAPAIVLSAAVFAPIHIVSLAGGGLTAMLATISVLFVPALLFGAVYEYTGNLVVVAVMHGLYNSLILTMIYIAITYGPEMEGAGQAGATLIGM